MMINMYFYSSFMSVFSKKKKQKTKKKGKEDHKMLFG